MGRSLEASCFRIKRSHRSESIGVHYYPAMFLEVDIRSDAHADLCLITEQTHGLFRSIAVPEFSHRLSCPIDHSTGRGLQSGHHLNLCHTSETVLFEERKVLVTNKLQNLGVLRNHGLDPSAH